MATKATAAVIPQTQWPVVGILVSSVMFMLVHLNKDWSVIGMTPIVLGAGVMLGLLAWASSSLVFCIIGHTLMDVGLFAYWWTQIAGVYDEKPISLTGVDSHFIIAATVFGAASATFLTSIWRLSRRRRSVTGVL